jgi:hypothetical protein
MFVMNGTVGNSVFGCNFRGPNADLVGKPPPNPVFQSFIQINSVGGVSSNNIIAGNDFNGIGGFTGAIMIYGSDGNQPGPQTNVIANNAFEHCGYYAVQLTSGTNNSISQNTMNDCSCCVEADDTGQVNTGNVIDSNHLTFTYGIGMNYPGCSVGCGWNQLTCGTSMSGGAFNYSGNSCTNNIVDGTTFSSLQEHANGGSGNEASYSGNTCTPACMVNGYF